MCVSVGGLCSAWLWVRRKQPAHSLLLWVPACRVAASFSRTWLGYGQCCWAWGSCNSYSGCGQWVIWSPKIPLEPNQSCLPLILTCRLYPLSVCVSLDQLPHLATSEAACCLFPLGDMGPLESPHHTTAGERTALLSLHHFPYILLIPARCLG